MKSLDLSAQKLISVRDVKTAVTEGATELLVSHGCVITPSAYDLLRQHNVAIHNGNGAASAPVVGSSVQPIRARQSELTRTSVRLFDSAEARAIKEEICAVGRKLWHRLYVDGNGGNISYRIGPDAVMCTPTLLSKFDLTPNDMCLVDLEGNQLAGPKPRTSEIFLHLEIYKAVPEAKAVVHCHPPHATAYAITGRVPPSRVVPEYEVFIGKVAIAPYETPGTSAFAQTVLPFVKQHNTVLLANHGIVSWADTVTHAEWNAEVLDTYCWTLMLAGQLGAPVSYISQEKATDLLAIKKRLGLPDIRFDERAMKECQLNDLQMPNSIALLPTVCDGPPASSELDVETVVKAVSDAVMYALGGK
jgi:L-fuculose-phosphate aldolase